MCNLFLSFLLRLLQTSYSIRRGVDDGPLDKGRGIKKEEEDDNFEIDHQWKDKLLTLNFYYSISVGCLYQL